MNETWKESKILQIGLIIAALFLGALAFPKPVNNLYVDWYQSYYPAAGAVISGQSPYDLNVGFLNPPWVAALLAPLTVFSIWYGAALLGMLNVAAIVLLCQKFAFSRAKMILTVMSPVTFYILIHGQIDGLVAAASFLPVVWWPVVAVSKPQAAIALGFKALSKEYILKASLIFVAIMGVSILLYGWWPVEMITSDKVASTPNEAYNILRGIWPLYVPLGVWLAMMGLKKDDHRYLLAASPFFFPYSAYHSFIGLWLLLIDEVNDWQAGLIFGVAWVSWWFI